MSDKDKELIKQAENTIWEDCDRLARQCESKEAYDAIKNIEWRKYEVERAKEDR